MNTWDEAKRQETLRERGLDFADAEELFAGRRYYSRPDNRRDYGEERFITVGYFSAASSRLFGRSATAAGASSR